MVILISMECTFGKIMDEFQSIKLLKQGDIHGLEILVDRYYFKAVRAAYLILFDRDQSEDIVQDCFIHAYEKIDQLNSDQFAPWFFRSVVNAALKAYKKSAQSVSIEDVDEQFSMDAWLDRSPGSLEDEVQANELKRSVGDALTSLPAEQRAVIVWKYYLDLSENEISLRMNRPVSTVKWWLFVARGKIRTWLGQQEKPFPAKTGPGMDVPSQPGHKEK